MAENKKEYLDLLLLADEQEDMIDRYLERGTMYILEDNGVKAECVVTNERDGILEIKNLAVAPECQRRGYGRQMIRFLEETYRGRYEILQVGTGDSPLTVPSMKPAALHGPISSPVSLQSTTTIRSLKAAHS